MLPKELLNVSLRTPMKDTAEPGPKAKIWLRLWAAQSLATADFSDQKKFYTLYEEVGKIYSLICGGSQVKGTHKIISRMGVLE